MRTRISWSIGAIAVILSLLFILCIRFDIGPRSLHYYITRSTPISSEEIDGIQLRTNLSEVAPVHGQAKATKETDQYVYYEFDSGIEAAALKTNHDIVRISIDGKGKQKTGKGISIGDSTRDVKARYGKNCYKRSEQGAEIIGYIDKNKKVTLEFWLNSNKVSLIRYDLKTMD